MDIVARGKGGGHAAGEQLQQTTYRQQQPGPLNAIEAAGGAVLANEDDRNDRDDHNDRNDRNDHDDRDAESSLPFPPFSAAQSCPASVVVRKPSPASCPTVSPSDFSLFFSSPRDIPCRLAKRFNVFLCSALECFFGMILIWFFDMKEDCRRFWVHCDLVRCFFCVNQKQG